MSANPLVGVEAFLADARAAASDGLTWHEFGELLLALIRLCVQTLDGITTMTGPEKKVAALAAVATLFDTLAPRCVPLAAYPLWAVASSPIRAALLAMCGGFLEQVLQMHRST